MQQSTRRSRALRLIAVAGAPVLVAAAACGSSGSSGSSVPQGLSGTEAGSGANQISAADAAAATTLTPTSGSFLAGKSTITVLGSTTPTNGDENPYAIWPVAETVGSVKTGDVLIDNFNNSSNNQGTGTTIVDLHSNGSQSVFAQLPQSLSGCTGGVGLTTAMVQLKTGWVIVGSLPSSNGKTATAAAGCLIVLSPTGKVAESISEPYLDGPWDAAVQDNGNTASLFVTNTLVGVTSATTGKVDQGNVVRLSLSQTATSAPKITAESVIASGFAESPDAAAFIKGPTGLALSPTGTLYVADNLGNRITAIPSAATRTSADGTGTVVTSGGQLSGPLGLVVAPDGDLLAANATNGKIVEITPAGKQVGEYYADDSIGQDPPGNGDLFDVAITQDGKGVLFVNDGTNILQELH
jgi:SMP-30/Gluconolactonase/LRE-like region